MSGKRKKKYRIKKGRFIVSMIIILLLAGFIVSRILYGMDKASFSLNGDKNITIEMGSEYTDEGCNKENAEKEGKVNTSKEGTYEITYTYKGRSLTRKVTVVDSSAIIMGLKGDSHTIVREGDEYIESGAFALYKGKGPIEDIKVSGKVKTNKPGTYEITYSCEAEGHEQSIVRSVEVVPADEYTADTDGIPVLMYHYVYTEGDYPAGLDNNYILDTELEKQLKYLVENDYYFPSFDELRAYIDGRIALPEKSVILTFDDGQTGFLKYGVPVLEKYKVPATSFLIGTKGAPKKVKKYRSEYVQYQSHSYDMHQGGGNIGHGGIVSIMDAASIQADLAKEAEISGNNDAFAYPFGDYTENAFAAVAAAGIDCAFTTEQGRVLPGSDFRRLPRVRVDGMASLENFIYLLGN